MTGQRRCDPVGSSRERHGELLDAAIWGRAENESSPKRNTDGERQAAVRILSIRGASRAEPLPALVGRARDRRELSRHGPCIPDHQRAAPAIAAQDVARTLRADGADLCVLPLLDAGTGPLLPLLHAFAAVAGFRSIDVVRADQTRERLAVWQAPLAAAAVFSATAANAGSLRLARRDIAQLRERNPTPVRLGAGHRVVHLNANLWFGLSVGGSVGHTAGVANALVSAGYSVDLASLSPPATLDEGVRPFRLKAPNTLGMPFEGNSYRFGRSVIRQITPLVSGEDLGFLYQRLSVANYSGATLSRTIGVPFVLEYNGSEAWTAQNWGRRLRYHDLAVAAESVSLRHAHLVVTVSDVLRREVIERGDALSAWRVTRIARTRRCSIPRVLVDHEVGAAFAARHTAESR